MKQTYMPRFCKECDEEVEAKNCGEDEVLNWCESCQQLEPDTYTINEELEFPIEGRFVEGKGFTIRRIK